MKFALFSLCVGAGVMDGEVDPSCIYATIRFGETSFVENFFLRGNCNLDLDINLADPIFLISFLFAEGPSPSCQDACDANDDGVLDIADSIYLLLYLFSEGPPPLPPVDECGPDETKDAVDCKAYPACL